MKPTLISATAYCVELEFLFALLYPAIINDTRDCGRTVIFMDFWYIRTQLDHGPATIRIFMFYLKP